jgi:hypothetical protein
MERKYKALFVLDPTHRRVAGEAKKLAMTIDEYITKLYEFRVINLINKENGETNEKRNRGGVQRTAKRTV